MTEAPCAALWLWGSGGRTVPDEAEVHSQGAVDPGAVDAQEHSIRDAGPAGVLGGAVKTRLLGERGDRHGIYIYTHTYSGRQLSNKVRIVS